VLLAHGFTAPNTKKDKIRAFLAHNNTLLLPKFYFCLSKAMC
jgi:hypothetical protein